MRPGPSPFGLRARLGAQVRSFRGTKPLPVKGGGFTLPVVDGAVSWSSTSGEVASARIKFAPGLEPVSEWCPLAARGQRLLVEFVYDADGAETRVPLGWFHIVESRAARDGVSVSALSLDYLIKSNPALWPSSPERGATLLLEAQRLADGFPVELDRGVEDRVLPDGLSWGYDRWDALTDLGASVGAQWVFKADGVLHAVPLRSARHVDLSLDEGVNLVEVDGSQEWNVYNRVVVVAKGDKDKNIADVSVVETLETAPFSPDLYGWRTKRIELESGSSVNDCRRAAIDELGKSVLTGRTARVSCVPDPRVELGDVVQVPYRDSWLTGRVSGMSLSLSAGSDMRLDLEELLW